MLTNRQPERRRRIIGRLFTQGFARDRRGVVAIVFALSVTAMVLAVGTGIDLARAYTARQQLSAVAALTCQYANRPTVVMLAFSGGGVSSYTTSVNSYYAVALADQNVTWTQTTSTPFTYTQGGAGKVTLAASVPTSVMHVVGVSSLPVSTSVQCFAVLASTPQQPTADATALLVNDGFENAYYGSTITWYLPNGTAKPWSDGAFVFPKVNTAPTSAGYVGSNGSEWIIMGYCLEIDYVGKTVSSVPQGTHSAELDCDNGSNTAGNSSISTKVYMAVGSYELRYYYSGRIANTDYGTAYICGTAASDTSWANDTSYAGGLGARTNQVNVYLDQNTTGSPPTHTTLDTTQTLGGSNLIDECVYSAEWIERSVPINVTTAGYYWLSFAADGASDSFGGQIDDIRLCPGTCTGSAGDDFPTSWLASSNGGTDVVLFKETFESPVYAGTYYNTNGNIGLSVGASSYWDLTGTGWSMAPVNQIPYWTSGCPKNNQCVEIGWHDSTGYDVGIARPFLLDPGYYLISYHYVTEVTFTGLSKVYCGATPSDAGIATLLGGSGTAMDRVDGANHGTLSWATGTVGLFMAHAQMASEPNFTTTLGATVTYTNPDGSVTASPTVPPNSISLTSFTQSTTSPLLDICGYAATSQFRTAYVYIQKPALYWLVFSILGTYNGFGAQIDNIYITAYGSPWMSGAPANPITIPVPNPQPGSTISYTGFSIIADQY